MSVYNFIEQNLMEKSLPLILDRPKILISRKKMESLGSEKKGIKKTLSMSRKELWLLDLTEIKYISQTTF